MGNGNQDRHRDQYDGSRDPDDQLHGKPTLERYVQRPAAEPREPKASVGSSRELGIESVPLIGSTLSRKQIQPDHGEKDCRHGHPDDPPGATLRANQERMATESHLRVARASNPKVCDAGDCGQAEHPYEKAHGVTTDPLVSLGFTDA
jgi:hypothetical protein